jgi:hypothetical protein
VREAIVPILRHDYETYSVVSLKKVGAWRYATHPSTGIWCMAYAVDDGPICIWKPGDPIPPEFIEAERNPDWRTSAHSDQFERYITMHIANPRYGMPMVPNERRLCSMADALAMSLPGDLDKLAKALDLTNRKDKAGARLMMQMSQPRKPRKGEPDDRLYWQDDPERVARLCEYCKQDVAVEREAHTVIGLGNSEPELRDLDMAINDRGMQIDVELIENAIRIAQVMTYEILDELRTITADQVTTIHQRDKLKAWLEAHGCQLTNVQKTTLKHALRRTDLPDAARRVIELRLHGAHAAASKFVTMWEWGGHEGRIHGAFRYHGTSTGRWVSFGAQLQNMKRPETDDLGAAIAALSTGDLEIVRQQFEQPLSVIGDITRGTLIAAPGHRLIAGDFSGIESRMIAFLAGEQTKLDAWAKFDQTQDPYDEPYYANGIAFGFAPEVARSPGKVGDLAFSYAGGVQAWRKFAPDDKSTDEEILRRRRAWRNTHPRITRWWDLLEAAALQAVTNPGRVFHAGKHIAFCFREPHLRMKLPSGRLLTYPFATTMINRFDDLTVTYKDASLGKWSDCNHGRGAYAGIWAENATSAAARDLLTAAMLRLEAAGYTINLHVHDEICAEVPEDFGNTDEFRRIMIERPDWAQGLPVEAKVREGHRFIKIKPVKTEAKAEAETKPAFAEATAAAHGAEDKDFDARHVVGDRERGPDPDCGDGDTTPDQMHWENLAGISLAGGIPAADGDRTDDPPPAGARLGAQPNPGLTSQPSQSYRKGPYPQSPHGHSGPKQGAQLASWIYRDIDGSNYLRVDKHVTADDKRHFYQHRWDETKQEWVYGVKGTYAERKVPYRLRELRAALKANPDLELQIGEGEKDVESLVRLGHVATTNPGGARNWTDDVTAWLRVLGVKNAAIHEDNDEAGRDRTRRLKDALSGFVTLRVVQYQDAPEGEDVSWWLENGHTPAELIARIAAAKPTELALEIVDIARRLKLRKPPPRGWLMTGQFCRKFLSGLVAPGATGKTALRILQAIALALGQDLTDQHVRRRVRVVLLSFEDDQDELDRRVLAACVYHKIDLDDLEGWLFVACPKGLKLAEARKTSFVPGALEPALRKAIEKHRPALVILDPFVKLHSLDENDNAAMDYIADKLTQLTHEYDIAIDCPAHTRKGALSAGDPDLRRGASAQRDAGRLDRTLLPMNAEEAELFGIDVEERKLYLRLDSAKVNLLPPARMAEWFKLVNVHLDNATDDDPEDEIQTVEPWTPPEMWEGLDDEIQNRILDQIEKGLPNGQRYSSASRATDRAAWKLVQEHVPDQTEAQCRVIIKTWEKKDHVIYTEDYYDPIEREDRKGLRVDPNKRPGTGKEDERSAPRTREEPTPTSTYKPTGRARRGLSDVEIKAVADRAEKRTARSMRVDPSKRQEDK